jgi:hypothetical protein
MRHAIALSIKFISIFMVLGIILGLFYNLAFTEVLTIAVVLTAVGYVLGDLFILRRTNNLTASIADFGLAFVVIWLMSRNMAYADGLITASLISSAAIAVVEYIYHRFVPRMVGRAADTDPGQEQNPDRSQFQTEAAEELTPVRPDVRSTNGSKRNNKNKKRTKRNRR